MPGAEADVKADTEGTFNKNDGDNKTCVNCQHPEQYK